MPMVPVVHVRRTMKRDITSIKRIDPPNGYADTENTKCFGQWDVELGMGRKYLVSHVEVFGREEVAVARYSAHTPERVDWRESRIHIEANPVDVIAELAANPPVREER